MYCARFFDSWFQYVDWNVSESSKNIKWDTDEDQQDGRKRQKRIKQDTDQSNIGKIFERFKRKADKDKQCPERDVFECPRRAIDVLCALLQDIIWRHVDIADTRHCQRR